MMDVRLKTFVFTLEIYENFRHHEIFNAFRGEASGGAAGAVAEGDTQPLAGSRGGAPGKILGF